jgi:mevalonate pyrophosphate decarboxylase
MYYVLYHRIFRSLANDIRYFHSIRLLTNEDIRIIKEDLFRLLDYIENLAFAGQFKETGNKVFFYISDINIDTNYACLEMEDARISILNAFF